MAAESSLQDRQWSWRSAGAVQIAILGAPVLLYSVAVWMHRFTAEDAFIYHRVVSNAVAGNGPVFNAGERVEVTTSMLWTAVLTAVRLVVGERIGVGTQAVVVGGLLAVTGLALATAGAVELQSARHRPSTNERTVFIPLSALTVAAAPVFWYWGTSGLETGLQLAWLGACWFGLCRRARLRSDVDRPRLLLICIGIGPFVRPELLIYSVLFAAAAFATVRTSKRSHGIVRALAWLLAAPLLLQVARMGYYGSLVPNTALAKDAGRATWSQGFAYLDATLLQGSYWISCLVGLAGVVVIGWRMASVDSRRLFVLAAPLVGAALHLVYVLRIGGDDVPDRFTAVPLFALGLPSAAIAVQLSRAAFRAPTAAAAGALAVLGGMWAAYSLGTNPLAPSTVPPYVTDYVTLRTNPVELTDILTGTAALPDVLSAHANNEDVLLMYPFGGGVPTRHLLARGSGVHVGVCCVGSAVAGLPLDVHVVDESSLADPIGARLVRNGATDLGVNGKLLPEPWAIAQVPGAGPDDSPDVAAARRALGCGDLAELDLATRDAMTPSRFLHNVLQASRLSTVVVPADPPSAESLFCQP